MILKYLYEARNISYKIWCRGFHLKKQQGFDKYVIIVT